MGLITRSYSSVGRCTHGSPSIFRGPFSTGLASRSRPSTIVFGLRSRSFLPSPLPVVAPSVIRCSSVRCTLFLCSLPVVPPSAARCSSVRCTLFLHPLTVVPPSLVCCSSVRFPLFPLPLFVAPPSVVRVVLVNAVFSIPLQLSDFSGCSAQWPVHGVPSSGLPVFPVLFPRPV